MKKTAEVLAIERGRLTECIAIDTSNIKEGNKALFSLSESKGKGERMVLRPRIEAIHAGMTRNKTFYPADKLKGNALDHSGVYSWTNPYPKPMIKNHNTSSDPTGRVENAIYITNSVTGKDSIVIIPTITDQETIEKVLDGRYLTVSIGATTDAAICSICGTNLIEDGWCGHDKGEKYDGIECYWIVGNLWFDECSWVNVPADTDAQVVDQGEVVVLEAFAEKDGILYDLGKEKNDTGYILTEQVAESYGLVTDKNTLPEDSIDGPGKMKEGMDDMTEEEKLALVKAEAASANPEANPSVDGSTAEDKTAPKPSDTDGATEVSEPEGSEVQGGAEETEEKVPSQEEETEAKDNNADDLSERVKQLELRVNELEAENQTLVDGNAELSAKFQKSLAERVVDLRISLGKPCSEDRDEAVSTYVGRSYESLTDTLSDLMLEQENFKGAIEDRTNNSVTNPASGAVDGEKKQTIEESSTPKKTPKKELTDFDVFKALLSGHKSL